MTTQHILHEYWLPDVRSKAWHSWNLKSCLVLRRKGDHRCPPSIGLMTHLSTLRVIIIRSLRKLKDRSMNSQALRLAFSTSHRTEAFGHQFLSISYARTQNEYFHSMPLKDLTVIKHRLENSQPCHPQRRAQVQYKNQHFITKSAQRQAQLNSRGARSKLNLIALLHQLAYSSTLKTKCQYNTSY